MEYSSPGLGLESDSSPNSLDSSPTRDSILWTRDSTWTRGLMTSTWTRTREYIKSDLSIH